MVGRGEDKETPIFGDGLMHAKRSHGAVASQGADILGESDNCLTPPPMGDDTPGEKQNPLICANLSGGDTSK